MEERRICYKRISAAFRNYFICPDHSLPKQQNRKSYVSLLQVWADYAAHDLMPSASELFVIFAHALGAEITESR